MQNTDDRQHSEGTHAGQRVSLLLSRSDGAEISGAADTTLYPPPFPPPHTHTQEESDRASCMRVCVYVCTRTCMHVLSGSRHGRACLQRMPSACVQIRSACMCEADAHPAPIGLQFCDKFLQGGAT